MDGQAPKKVTQEQPVPIKGIADVDFRANLNVF
jgi:hypothetical protein